MSEKLSERLCEVAGALESTNRMRGIEIARIAQKVAALEQQLAAKYAEIARLRKQFDVLKEFHGHCWCGECDADFRSYICPEGYRTFVCLDIAAALAETPAAPEAK